MKPPYFSWLAEDYYCLISLPVGGSWAGSLNGPGLFGRGGVHVLVGVGTVAIARNLGLGLTGVRRVSRVGRVGRVGRMGGVGA